MLTIYQPTPEGKQKPQMTYKITQIQINLIPRAKSPPPPPAPRPPPQGDSKESLTSNSLEITQIIIKKLFFLSFSSFFKSVTQAPCKNRNSELSQTDLN